MSTTYSYFKKDCNGQYSILDPKGTLGTVILRPWHHDEPALLYFANSMLTVL